jgi:hypothetical protein
MAEQVRQLGDVGGDAPRFVARQQLHRRAPAGLILEIHVRELLAVGVADDKKAALFFSKVQGGGKRRGSVIGSV